MLYESMEAMIGCTPLLEARHLGASLSLHARLLLKLEGIECRGYYTDTHMWTVAILDGVEYHIDTTWGDAGDSAYAQYFAMTPEQSALYHRQ